eukprot:SAG22_NODE_13465_length_405_cov_1.849673_1_plen_72_part_01
MVLVDNLSRGGAMADATGAGGPGAAEEESSSGSPTTQAVTAGPGAGGRPLHPNPEIADRLSDLDENVQKVNG